MLRALSLVGLVLVAGVGAFLLRDHLTFEALRDNREALIAFRDANMPLTVLAFIAAYAALVAFSLPGAAIATLTGGFLFGTFPGVLWNVTGATLGAVALFIAARWGLGDWLRRRIDATQGIAARVAQGLDDNQWSMLFLIRLVPAVPFFVANLIPALLGVPLWRFVVSTFVGIIPGALVYTSVGAGLGSVFASGGTPDWAILFEPQVLLPIIGLCVLALLPVVLRLVTGRREVLK